MIAIHVNGKERRIQAAADKPLLWALREDLGFDWHQIWLSPTAHREAETAKAHRG